MHVHFRQIFIDFSIFFAIRTLVQFLLEISLYFSEHAVDYHPLRWLGVSVFAAPLQREPTKLKLIVLAIFEVPFEVV